MVENEMIKKKKILMIDDEESFCYPVKVNLEQTGEFEVITCNRAEDGIRLARKEQPDLILLDIIMPGMPGEEAKAALLEDPRTKDIPAIFLTAMVTHREIKTGTMKMIGGHNFIAKPIKTEDLVRCIKEII